MIIYRVENQSQQGMYRWHRSSRTAASMCKMPHHPLPSQDSSICGWWNGKSCTERFRFGFKSIEQLKMWIYDQEVRDELERVGLVISIYRPGGWIKDYILEYCLGDTQAVFNFDQFEKIGEFPWERLKAKRLQTGREVKDYISMNVTPLTQQALY